MCVLKIWFAISPFKGHREREWIRFSGHSSGAATKANHIKKGRWWGRWRRWCQERQKIRKRGGGGGEWRWRRRWRGGTARRRWDSRTSCGNLFSLSVYTVWQCRSSFIVDVVKFLWVGTHFLLLKAGSDYSISFLLSADSESICIYHLNRQIISISAEYLLKQIICIYVPSVVHYLQPFPRKFFVHLYFEGTYDPSEYENLNVSPEIKELFAHVMRYTPQTIDLDTRFKPFIPEYIPAVGDIDAFIKVRIRFVYSNFDT